MGKKNLLLSSLLFSFTLCFFAPLELYLTNRNEFWFDIHHFIGIPIITCIAVFVILLLFGMICSDRLRSVFTSLIFASACLMYIQSNFLNKNVGIMNGMQIQWEEYRISFIVNWAIWVAVIIIILVWYTRNSEFARKFVSYISVCILLIQIFTVSTLLIIESMDESGTADRYLSMKNVYDISEDENIVVFVLDMFDDTYFDELIAEETQTADMFDGFTQYTNFVGGYGTTVYSMGHLLTGDYLLNQKGLYEDDINYLYEDTVVFDELVNHGYNLDIYTYDFCIPHKLKQKLSNYCDGKSEVTSYYELTCNLYKLAACKYLPDFFKQHCWLTGSEFDEVRGVNGEYPQQSFSNVDFYNGLVSNGLTTKEGKTFKLIHLDGTHFPYTMNENVEEVGVENSSVKQCTKGCINLVLKYLEEMKACGVYDNSSIIITADHGYYEKGIITNPVLLVKPKSAHGELKFSDACISQKDFHPTILSFAGLNDDLQYGYGYTDVEEGIARDRYYYQYVDVKNQNNTWNRRLIEYKIDPDSNERKNFHITGYEYDLTGQKVDHLSICSVCQAGDGETENPDALIIHE